jgi:hypothetical protein
VHIFIFDFMNIFSDQNKAGFMSSAHVFRFFKETFASFYLEGIGYVSVRGSSWQNGHARTNVQLFQEDADVIHS